MVVLLSRKNAGIDEDKQDNSGEGKIDYVIGSGYSFLVHRSSSVWELDKAGPPLLRG